MRQRNRVLPIAIVAGCVLILVLGIFILRKISGSAFSPNRDQKVSTIILKNNGEEFSLDLSGNAIWVDHHELWDRDKTNAFFDYYYANWVDSAVVVGETATVSTDGSDELANTVTGGGSTTPPSQGGSGSGGSGGSGGAGGSGGSGGGSGGNGGAPSWCKHWRLSYCADLIPPSPTTTATPIPTPSPTSNPGSATPLPPDCNNPGNQQTGRTVIGNELCVSASPTPTP